MYDSPNTFVVAKLNERASIQWYRNIVLEVSDVTVHRTFTNDECCAVKVMIAL